MPLLRANLALVRQAWRKIRARDLGAVNVRVRALGHIQSKFVGAKKARHLARFALLCDCNCPICLSSHGS